MGWVKNGTQHTRKLWDVVRTTVKKRGGSWLQISALQKKDIKSIIILYLYTYHRYKDICRDVFMKGIPLMLNKCFIYGPFAMTVIFKWKSRDTGFWKIQVIRQFVTYLC